MLLALSPTRRSLTAPAADLVRELIGHVADALEHAADRASAEVHALALLADGTGSVAQRAAATAGLPVVLRLLAERTVPATGHEAAAAG
ncbi:hypothetical protein ABZU76_18240 [Amycolatopsis sp. NPDC005232]|uniref:hypothetical protein n=1 Tax=Amycolatopsis sp. NPDC005232 TaxID=3157027 RepID=UPI0033A9614A